MAMRTSPRTKATPYVTPPSYRTMDLCCGVGGIRLAFERTRRVNNVFAADINKDARKVYKDNFGDEPAGDFMALDPASLPAFDILLAGFPCQAFSTAGKRKGFADPRGTVFFGIAEIIAAHRPAAFVLENVKGLTHHDGGRTLTVIERTVHGLGYDLSMAVVDARDFDGPQKRQRLILVGRRRDLAIDFAFPVGTGQAAPVRDFLEKGVAAKYWLSPQALAGSEAWTARQAANGNGFGMVVLDLAGPANTLTVGGSGERNLVIDANVPRGAVVNARHLRHLTPRECARLQGFPDCFRLDVSDHAAYRLMGNSVCVPVFAAVAESLVQALDTALGVQLLRKAA